MKTAVYALAALAPVALAQTTLCGQYEQTSANGYQFNNNNWGKGSASSGSQTKSPGGSDLLTKVLAGVNVSSNKNGRLFIFLLWMTRR